MKMPKNLKDIADWHIEIFELQLQVANQFKENGHDFLYEEWKRSAIAHKKCQELIEGKF